MSSEAWAFAGLLVVQGAGVLGIWLKVRRPQASTLDESSSSTLEDIRTDVRAIRHALTEHLQDHTRAGMSVPKPRGRAS